MYDGTVETVSKKQKGFVDLRPYAIRCRRRAWTQAFFDRWSSTTNAGGVTLISAFQLWQSIRNPQNAITKVRLVP